MWSVTVTVTTLCMQYTLNPIHYITLHPTPYILYSLTYIFCNRHLISYTLCSISYTYAISSTINPSITQYSVRVERTLNCAGKHVWLKRTLNGTGAPKTRLNCTSSSASLPKQVRVHVPKPQHLQEVSQLIKDARAASAASCLEWHSGTHAVNLDTLN